MRSPVSLPFSRLNSPSSIFSCSSSVLYSSLFASFFCSPLNVFQQLHVLLVTRGPKRNAVFEVNTILHHIAFPSVLTEREFYSLVYMLKLKVYIWINPLLLPMDLNCVLLFYSWALLLQNFTLSVSGPLLSASSRPDRCFQPFSWWCHLWILGVLKQLLKVTIVAYPFTLS